ncbi:hypothetical protein [Sphingomicrobium flavum]|uniref:hypothetical protein n=1 Tax=Sphingomicrobium flavum TaxID=1229164 RepID=UPI0021ADD8C5|nr:hypothetical protein [Sphingomicrobium flavum]
MGLFKFLGGVIGAGKAKKQSRKAMQAQIDALNRGIDVQDAQFRQTREDFSPFREAGYSGLSGLGDLVGINGDESQQAAIEALYSSPFYQSLYRNGEEALLQTAAATGGMRGGNTQRGLADFGADTLMRTIDRQLASLGGLAGMGMGATESVANFGQQHANNVTNLYGQQGAARAGHHLFKGGVNNAMWNNAGAFADKAVSAFMPGGGGFGSLLAGGF